MQSFMVDNWRLVAVMESNPEVAERARETRGNQEQTEQVAVKVAERVRKNNPEQTEQMAAEVAE